VTTSQAAIEADAKADRPEPPRYARLMGLSWLHLLNDGASNYLPGVLPAVLVALGESTTVAGSMMSALLIGQALQVVTGGFADYVGGRLFIVLGVLGSSAAGAAIGLAPNIWVLVAALFVIGVSSALFHPPALAATRRLSGARHGLSMSLFLVGGELGRGVWPLVASIVAVSFGLRYLWLLALPAVISVALLWGRIPHPAPPRRDSHRIDWRRHLGPASALTGFALLRALAGYGVVTYLPVLWHLRGHGLVAGAALITVLLVVGIIGNIGGGHIADRLGRRPVLLGSSVMAAILLAVFLVSSGLWQWIVLGLLGIAVFAVRPIIVLIGQDIFAENQALGSGIALGLSNSLAAAALAGLDPVAAAGGPKAVMWVLVGVLVLASIVSLRLPVDRSRP